MTTPVDLGILESFSFIFPMILVYAGILGALSYKQTFNPLINNLIAIMVAIMMLFAPNLIEVLIIAIPWMVVIGVFGSVLLIIAKFHGVEDAAIRKSWDEDALVWWFAASIIIIFIFSVGIVYFGDGEFFEEGESAVDSISEGRGGDRSAGEVQFFRSLFHPNVLGFLMIMIIAIFTVALMATKPNY